NKMAYGIMNTLEFLENCEEPGIIDWVQNKKQPWILAGLSPAFTKIAQTIWTSTPFTTNAGESAHANINRNGHNLSLLAAINKLQWCSAYTYKKTNTSDRIGINHPYKELLMQLKKAVSYLYSYIFMLTNQIFCIKIKH
ncbi:11923_t:CDS:2, partial [Gigaspora rosea]